MTLASQNQARSGGRAPGLAAGVLLVALILGLHLPRLFLPLPVYAGDEGAYLIRALLGGQLKADPGLYPSLPDVDNTVFFWIVKLAYALPGGGLVALRLLGACAYVGGVVLVWRAVRHSLTATEAPGVLLLALIFPYYRFVITALPEGWYVGLLGLIIFLTARFYRSRPWLHAAGLGGLIAALVLIKPHGVAVGAGFAALVIVDAVFDAQRRLLITAGRLVLFAVGFLVVGHGLQFLDGHGPPHGLVFFGSGFYSMVLGAASASDATHAGEVAFVAMATGALLLAGVPIALGLDHLMLRWRAEPGVFRLQPQDLSFLLTLFALAATLVMVAVFATKVAAITVTESFRLWGRYFEFFVPLIWLTAWPYVRVSRVLPDRNILSAGMVLAGLAGLVVALKGGIALLPWDATALSAFFIPNSPPWPAITAFPFFPIACAATIACIVATLAGAPTLRIWQAYFAVLGLLSCGLNMAWWSDVSPARDELYSDLKAARRLPAPGQTATFVDDPNAGANIFLELRGRTHLVIATPAVPLPASALAPYRTVIVENGLGAPDPAWRLLQAGKQFKVYQRGSLDTPIR